MARKSPLLSRASPGRRVKGTRHLKLSNRVNLEALSTSSAWRRWDSPFVGVNGTLRTRVLEGPRGWPSGGGAFLPETSGGEEEAGGPSSREPDAGLDPRTPGS